MINRGSLSFTLQSRVLRELGERLVKQPEVAILELIKNAYDADAVTCSVRVERRMLVIEDDGSGMTLQRFRTAWMTIGTGAKTVTPTSARFGRPVTGEKGIGRFAVRFLGGRLRLVSNAFDAKRECVTELATVFDWERFDQEQDIGNLKVKYVLRRSPEGTPTGTSLTITHPRTPFAAINWKQIRTGAAGVVTGRAPAAAHVGADGVRTAQDPGFRLRIATEQDEEDDLATSLLNFYALRASVELNGTKVSIAVNRRGSEKPFVLLEADFPNVIGPVQADIRFFPRRAGALTGAPIDGRVAYTWLRENGGVFVFDNGFQVRPYGFPGDDWLGIDADASRNHRDPRSSFTSRHLRMSRAERAAPGENWMLRLPGSAQLVGNVHVRGVRGKAARRDGLVAAADREGFVDNLAFRQLWDLIRGAVEAIAYADRRIQQDEAAEKARQAVEESRAKTTAAISDIRADRNLAPAQRDKIVAMLVESQTRVERHEEGTKSRERQLEVMSLLGVVGGFMTHEFGAAIEVLRKASAELARLAETDPAFAVPATSIARHGDALRAFVEYSRAYIQGARVRPKAPYAARPRLLQIRKVFGKYASDRGITVDVEVEADVMVPLIPAALYNGVAQNLFTNALKAVVANPTRPDGGHRIVFRAWNEARLHRLQVSDTGRGIAPGLRSFVFDPLFTTTADGDDPLGSGMGLGLALVKRGAQAFGGDAQLAQPPPGFVTCVEVRFPLEQE